MLWGHRSVTRVLPIGAVLYVLYGLVMLVQPTSRTKSAVYSHAFDLAARQVWAGAFIACGLLVLLTFHPIAVFALEFVALLWGLLLLLAATQHPGISYTGVVMNLGVPIMLIAATGRAGVRDGS